MPFFLSLLLLIKKNKSHAGKILVFWLLLISVDQVFNYFNIAEVLYQYPHWLGVDLVLPVLIGVFLYFYVSDIAGNTLNSSKIVLHLLPTLILLLLTIPFYKLTGEEKIYVFSNDGKGFEWYLMIQNSLIIISGLSYSIWSIFLIKKHRIKIKDTFSNTDKKELLWLLLLSVGFVIIWGLAVFFDNVIIFSAVVILVLCIAIFGINQLSIFNSNTIPQEESEAEVSQSIRKVIIKPKSTTEKYEKSGLNEDMASEIYSNLNALVKENAIYKNEELTLVELAKKLQVHPNHLSQVINEMEGKNFYNYINSLRIKEFIKIAVLPENKKYTMISLAYDCGFSTKSTFNRHFKSQTGKTPTEFFNS